MIPKERLEREQLDKFVTAMRDMVPEISILSPPTWLGEAAGPDFEIQTSVGLRGLKLPR